MVQVRDRQITKEKAKRLIVEGKLAKSNAATTLANAATKRSRTNFVRSRLVENWPRNPLTKEIKK